MFDWGFFIFRKYLTKFNAGPEFNPWSKISQNLHKLDIRNKIKKAE